MSDILSDDQISALVEAAKQGETLERSQHEHRPRGRRVREIDFSRPTKFSQDQQRRVERSHESFCRSAATQLSAELRTPIDLEVINVAQLAWSNALAEIPAASTYGLVLAQPVGTRLLVAVEQAAISRLLERMLGGGAAAQPVLREPTDIEMVLTRRLFQSLLSLLSPTWEELMGITLELDVLETQTASVQLAPPSEPTLALTIEVSIEDHSSTISLVAPYLSIATVASRIPSGQYGDLGLGPELDEETAHAVRLALSGVEVELRAEVASVGLTVEELLGIREGDVVQLEGSIATGVTLCADLVPIHRARPGRTGSRRALEILERLEAGE